MGDKQQALLNSIAKTVQTTISPMIDSLVAQIGTEFANHHTILSSIIARLEIIDINNTPSVGNIKRAPRGERKTATNVVKNINNGDPEDKIRNARLYTRWMWAKNQEFRNRYGTPELQAQFSTDNAILKHPVDSIDRLFAEGFALWRLSSGEIRNKITIEFKRWNEERIRAQITEPLNVDEKDEESDNEE